MRTLLLYLAGWFLLGFASHSSEIDYSPTVYVNSTFKAVNGLTYPTTGIDYLDTAYSYLGVTEKTGKNDGYYVELFTHGLKVFWCAGFTNYCLESCGYKTSKKRLWAKAAIKENSIDAIDVLNGKIRILKGSEIIWTRGRGGHVGFTTKDWVGKNGFTISGNTSGGKGSVYNGGGVYINKRSIKQFAYKRIIKFTIRDPELNKLTKRQLYKLLRVKL